MKLYEVQVTYPDLADSDPRPVRYRNIVGENEEQAITKANDRHHKAGGKFAGAEFKVVSAKLILCPTAVEGME